MSDIALVEKDNEIDFALENGDLVLDEGLETAVVISLFSDRRVEKSELPRGESQQKGWWGDLLSEVEGDQIGSKLWLLNRGKLTLETVPRTENFVRECLQWAIDDGVAERVNVVSALSEQGRIQTKVDIVRPESENNSFDFVWDGQEMKRG